MVYKKFGETFRSIREQNNISLSKFASIGISKSSLSRFENGETMMSFESVFNCLEIMGVSLEDYEQLLNDYSPTESDFLVQEIESASTNLDTKKLSELAKLANNGGYTYIALAAQSSIQPLNETETEILTDYFYEINVWNSKELCIFFLSMNSLSIHDILHILDNFLDKGHKLFNSRKSRGYLVQACCRAIALFSYSGYRDYAKYIMNQMDKHNLVNSMFLRNVRNMAKGYWIYCFENRKKGQAQMLAALDIFHAVSTPEVANYYQTQYDNVT